MTPLKEMKGRDQLIVWFASVAHPKLELEKIDIFGAEYKVSTTVDMWL